MPRESPLPSRQPLVSVIIPAFNAVQTLERTLHSAERQIYPNLEFIIVDDGSTDGTAALAAAFCEAAPRRRLLIQRNGGVARARNAGIFEARGEFVAPLDADDLWHPSKIDKQVRCALSAREEPGFVYCWFRFIDGSDDVSGRGPRLAVNGRAFERHFFRNFVGNGSALLVRRSALLEVGGYDQSDRLRSAGACDDVLLQLKLASRYPVACVPEFLVGYRTSNGSMSADKERMFRSWLVVSSEVQKKRRVSLAAQRWALAYRKMALAESRAWRGRWLTAAKSLVGAILIDPVRSLPWLAYRLVRAMKRRAHPHPPERRKPFTVWDPVEDGPADPYRLKGWADWFVELDETRMRKLEPRD